MTSLLDGRAVEQLGATELRESVTEEQIDLAATRVIEVSQGARNKYELDGITWGPTRNLC